jgi:predicted membrane-bound spermidine synthase
MVVSSPDRSLMRPILIRAILIGVALGVIGVAAASLLIGGGPGLLTEGVGLVVTALVALGAGMWVSAPAAGDAELPMRERWAAAGLATAAAGVFATAWRIYAALSGGMLSRTLGLLFLVALPVYSIGLSLPTLLAVAERWQETVDDDTPGWGVLGVLVLGVLGGSMAGLLLPGLLLVPLLTAGPVLLATSVLLLSPLVIAEPEEPEMEEVVLREDITPFSELRVTEISYPGERQPERRLYLNGEEESAELVRSGAPALAYIAAAETWLMSSTAPGSAFLFLGGGAYTLPRRLAERDPRARITVVELDPEVTRIAQHYFGLRREHRITTVHGDARAFASREEVAPRYDRIYVDVYAGTEALPYALVTREAFQDLARHLRPGGVIAMNVIGVLKGRESIRLWSVARTLESVFPATALYHHLGPDYPDRQNVLLAGSLDPDHRFLGRAGLFERMPHEQWPNDPRIVVYRDLVVAPRLPETRPPVKEVEKDVPALRDGDA